MADPLASLPYPDFSVMTNYGGILGPGTYNPGYYPGGVDFNNGTAQLNPGVYYFKTGIDIHGSARVQGDGVMLFIAEGGLTTSGSDPGLTLTPPTSGTYAGVAIFQHRSNTTTMNIGGGGLFDVRGTIYAAGAHISIDGNPGRRIGKIISRTLQMRGTGNYVISGEGHPAPGQLHSYLVD
jgi:hypothetical protein